MIQVRISETVSQILHFLLTQLNRQGGYAALGRIPNEEKQLLSDNTIFKLVWYERTFLYSNLAFIESFDLNSSNCFMVWYIFLTIPALFTLNYKR